MKSPRSVTEIKALLERYNIAPLKKYGQHFLHDGNICRKLEAVVESFLEPQPELILEIGPGMGALTGSLLGLHPAVYLVEIDNTLVKILEEMFSLPAVDEFPEDFINRSLLIHRDFFALERNRILAYQKSFFITGNISYQITSPLFFTLLEWHIQAPSLCRGAVLVIQKEVAERIHAAPHSREYGLLSVLMRNYFNTAVHFHIQPNSFYPVPGVTSSCISLVPRADADITLYAALKTIVKASFSQRRKKLVHNTQSLVSDEAWHEFLHKTGHKETIRAENVSPDEYALLAELSRE